MNLKNVGCCCFQPPRPARASAQVGVTFGHGTALPWSWEPQRGAGGPWGGEDSNEESGIPSASPPPQGLNRSSPPGNAVPGGGQVLAREVRGWTPAIAFPSAPGLFCQSRGSTAVTAPWGWAEVGGEQGGPTAVFIPQPKTITNDANSQKIWAGGRWGMCQLARGSQMCSSSSRAAAPR